MPFLWEWLFVKANWHKKIPARNSVSMSDVFCVVYVVQYIAKNCFSKYCSSHCTMGLPGRSLPPLAIFGSPPRSKLTFKLFSNNIPNLSTWNRNCTNGSWNEKGLSWKLRRISRYDPFQGTCQRIGCLWGEVIIMVQLYTHFKQRNIILIMYG